MKTTTFYFSCFFLFSLLISSCNQVQKANQSSHGLSVLQKIANANGLENWKNVEELQYTFNVDRDSSHFQRSWTWYPQSDKVSMINSTDTITYLRKDMDSLQRKTDQAFINDNYWLLFPFHLVWDEGFSHSVRADVKAPLSGEKVKEIAISYNNTKGYTPGDTYKIYVDKNFMIREWAFYPSGSKEPRLITTWEDYIEKNGITLATQHQNKEESFKLYFTDIVVN